MTATLQDIIISPTVDGASLNLKGLLGIPDTPGPWPAVVVVHEAFGIEAEMRKQVAIRDFLEHIIRVLQRTPAGKRWNPISVGFSDDDPANVLAVENYIRAELSRLFPGVKFVLYDTSDPALDRGRKITVAGQLDLGL